MLDHRAARPNSLPPRTNAALNEIGPVLMRRVAIAVFLVFLASTAGAQTWAPLRYCDGGDRLAWIGRDAKLWSWRWDSKAPPTAIQLAQPPLLNAFLGPACRLALVQTIRDNVRGVSLVDVHTGRSRTVSSARAGDSSAFAVDDEHDRIALVTSEAAQGLVWLDTSTFAVTGEAKLGGYSASVDAIEVTADGRVLLAGSGRYACIVEPGVAAGDCHYGMGARGGMQDDLRSVALTADGKTIALGTLGHEVFFRRVRGDGRDVELVPNGGRPLPGVRPQFSPAGDRLLVVQNRGVVVHPIGAAAAPVELRNEQSPRAAIFSPDGRRVAVLESDDQVSIWRVDGAIAMGRSRRPSGAAPKSAPRP